MKGATYGIKAIPTMYDNVMMRSRLEARWAAFFSACGWQWNYEPIDAYGWCPDFVLNFNNRSVYVEVKPVINQTVIAEFVRVSGLLLADRKEDSALLVGESPNFAQCDSTIGVGTGRGSWDDGTADDILIGGCGANTLGCMVGMAPMNALYDCWCCDQYDGSSANNEPAFIKALWARACNETQWKR